MLPAGPASSHREGFSPPQRRRSCSSAGTQVRQYGHRTAASGRAAALRSPPPALSQRLTAARKMAPSPHSVPEAAASSAGRRREGRRRGGAATALSSCFSRPCRPGGGGLLWGRRGRGELPRQKTSGRAGGPLSWPLLFVPASVGRKSAACRRRGSARPFLALLGGVLLSLSAVTSFSSAWQTHV